MSKHDPKPSEAAEQSVTLPASSLQEMIAALVQKGVAEALMLRSPDERFEESLEIQRRRHPPHPEKLVKCLSPITGATFTARMTRNSRVPGSAFRVVELVDYEMPAGWNVWQQDGGLVPNGTPMVNEVTRQPEPKFMWEVMKTYYKRDNDALCTNGGRPLPDRFRLDFAPSPGSVVLSAEQLAKLGITAEQVNEAIGEVAGE